MFVGNHTLFGLYDLPHLWLTLYRRYGLMLRGLADHVHARIPLWWWLLSRYGAVVGTPENAAWLLQRGESLLVFPGGGREVARRRGDKYRLHWKQRAGFARLAAAHRCTIVPFAQVGAEEAWDVVVDADQLMQTPVGALVRRLGWRPEVLWPPVVRGLGPTAVPRPGPLHFYFGEPLPGDTHGAHPQDPQSCFALRERVRQAVQAGIEQLLEHRDRA
jgi:1-acyl-sn-glycerol-3-phosphate acyltransferase